VSAGSARNGNRPVHAASAPGAHATGLAVDLGSAAFDLSLGRPL